MNHAIKITANQCTPHDHRSVHRALRFFVLTLVLVAFSPFSPLQAETEPESSQWLAELQAWKQHRLESLKRPFGWLSLVGMEWLHKGSNSIGSAADNRIQLSHGAPHVGDFDYDGEKLFFTPAPGVEIHANDQRVTDTIPVATDQQENTTKFRHDSYEFYVIERGKPALRIKDSQAPTRVNFAGLEYFPADPKWRVKARFIPYQPPKSIEIVNVLGLLNKEPSPGALAFELNGKPQRLDVIDEGGDEYFVIFADRTNGRSTYGPGRFVYVKNPDANGETWLDFNRAYNPPCAFTDYSTCPLPPPQNRLREFITAGEKKYHGGSHARERMD